ncbi:MAG: hypothetical protein HC898_03090 [Phycisphaerales bacterium]|nr:hypothetical protein [Phycisphaerales bacterium]
MNTASTLETKPDFARTMERMEAWWHCQVIDRAVVQMYVKPTKPCTWPKGEHETLRQRWMDVEFQARLALAEAVRRDYVADSFPMWMPNLGPEILATLYGVDLEFGDKTSWSKPILHDGSQWAEVVKIQPDFHNVYWQTIEQLMDCGLELGRGKYLVGVPDLHGSMDILAALREPQELCIDLLEYPQDVQAAGMHFSQGFVEAFNRCVQKLKAHGQPITTWLHILHEGPCYIPNCDFWCMLSPQVGRDMAAPMTRVEMQPMARSIYHLDGPDALRHLDTVLELPGLNGVQFICGAGKGPAAKWLDVYKRCLAAGKCVHIDAQGPEDAMMVLRALGPEGLKVNVGHAFPDVASAQAFVKDVAKVTKAEI